MWEKLFSSRDVKLTKVSWKNKKKIFYHILKKIFKKIFFGGFLTGGTLFFIRSFTAIFFSLAVRFFILFFTCKLLMLVFKHFNLIEQRFKL